ncbi:hypothetical protein [Citrifermentans bremense]|uniref:hypothetical protein n=1 Tax=Citrifermentans bremense TaxID=60035 RepID=UPI00041731F6|nr:hypothetical protein [Citrifermentans bremense]
MPLAVSLIFPYLFGLGALLALLCGSIREQVGGSGDAVALQRLACCLIFGIGLNHFLVLLLSDLKISLITGCFLSCGAFLFLLLRHPGTVRQLCSAQRLALCAAFYIACLYVVLGEPVSGWDARSIWFLHGKMIFYSGSVDAGKNWLVPSLSFSHLDYPNLVPIIAAQVALLAGYWNEYLPKLSLVALLLPALLLLLSLFWGKWRRLLLIAIPLLFTWPWLKNGYMDGYLALYAGLAAFYLGRWLERFDRLDLVTGLVACVIVLQLKNEGMLYVPIVAAVATFFLLLKRSRRDGRPGAGDTTSLTPAPLPKGEGRQAGPRLQWGEVREGLVLVAFAFSGWGLWERKKHLFKLKNDLNLGLQSLDMVQQRLSDGSLGVILKYLYVVNNVNLSLGILLLSLVWNLRKGNRPGVGALFCMLVGGLYFSGIVAIYLATPHDLISFHLPTGERTMLPVHIILLAASLSLFTALHSPDGRSQRDS